MKRFAFTMFAASVMAANVALAGDVVVYGKANVSLQSFKVEDSTAAPDEVVQDNWEVLSNSSRLGVRGDSEISDGFSAIYQLEYETMFDDGEKDGKTSSAGTPAHTHSFANTFTQRNIFVGLKGSYGSVMAGMHDSPVKMVGELVDVFSDYELGDIRYLVEGENRVKNMVMYRSPVITPGAGGLMFDLQFAPGEEDGGDPAANKRDQDGPADQISASAAWKADFGLTVALALDSDVDDRDLTRLVVAYNVDQWGLNAMLQSAEEVSRVGTEEEEAVILSGYCKVGNWKMKLLAGAAEITDDAVADIDTTQLVLGVDYALGNKSKVYGYAAQIEEETDNATEDTVKETTFGIGMEHKF